MGGFMIEYLQYNHYFRCLICNWYEQKNEEGKSEDISNLKTKILDLKEGDKIVITGGYPFKESKHTNFMKIEEL